MGRIFQENFWLNGIRTTWPMLKINKNGPKGLKWLRMTFWPQNDLVWIAKRIEQIVFFYYENSILIAFERKTNLKYSYAIYLISCVTKNRMELKSYNMSDLPRTSPPLKSSNYPDFMTVNGAGYKIILPITCKDYII